MGMIDQNIFPDVDRALNIAGIEELEPGEVLALPIRPPCSFERRSGGLNAVADKCRDFLFRCKELQIAAQAIRHWHAGIGFDRSVHMHHRVTQKPEIAVDSVIEMTCCFSVRRCNGQAELIYLHVNTLPIPLKENTSQLQLRLAKRL